MKQASNKQIATVFKEAKKYLATSGVLGDKGTRYICVAIDSVRYTNPKLGHGCSCAQNIINERLGDSYTVFTWLVTNGFMKRNTLDNIKYVNQLQKYRHRWLDSLIKEFSA